MLFNLKGFGVLLVPLMLMACSSAVELSSGNSKYVTYKVPDMSQISDAAKLAEEYCADFGKESVPQVDSSADGLRTFECK